MNENQKKVLQLHHQELVRDLELRPDLIGSFIHLGLFNEDMIEEIQNCYDCYKANSADQDEDDLLQAESTRKKQIQKMLSILPRRGPRAFDKFVRAIHDSYDWLAKGLRDSLQEYSTIFDTGQISDREKVAIYVHEHFGTSKRFCEDDKKDIRKFLLKQIRFHRDETDSFHRQDSMETDTNPDESLKKEVENNLLKKVYELLVQNNEGDKESPCETPEDINIDIIESKVNELNGKVSKLEEQINDCYNVIGVDNHDIPLPDLVQKLAKDHEKLTKVETDLDNLEKHRKAMEIKLEVTQERLSRKAKELAGIEHENEKLYAQRKELREKVDKLEELHYKHIEKERTLMTLKGMVNKLRPTINKSIQEPLDYVDGSDNYISNEEDGHCKSRTRLSLPRINGAHGAHHGTNEKTKHIKRIPQHPSITKAKEIYEHPWR